MESSTGNTSLLMYDFPMPTLAPQRNPPHSIAARFNVGESIRFTEEDLNLNVVQDVYGYQTHRLTESPFRGEQLILLYFICKHWNDEATRIFLAPQHRALIRTLLPGAKLSTLKGPQRPLIQIGEVALYSGYLEGATQLYKPFFTSEVTCFSEVDPNLLPVDTDYKTGVFYYQRQRNLLYNVFEEEYLFDVAAERFVCGLYLEKIDLDPELIPRIQEALYDARIANV